MFNHTHINVNSIPLIIVIISWNPLAPSLRAFYSLFRMIYIHFSFPFSDDFTLMWECGIVPKNMIHFINFYISFSLRMTIVRKSQTNACENFPLEFFPLKNENENEFKFKYQFCEGSFWSCKIQDDMNFYNFSFE